MERNETSVKRMLHAIIQGIFDSGRTAVIDGSFFEEISPFVEQSSTLVRSPEEIVQSLHKIGSEELLDFGCGTGAHRPMLEQIGYRWRGINYREAMPSQVADMAKSDERILFYNGRLLPFNNSEFDVVYSFQVFEHIQNIASTFGEIRRVLKPGGALVGSVAYLEQIHDYSTFNFTPYGLKLACKEAGLRLVKLYPRFDVFTFFLRRLLVVTSASDDNSLTNELCVDNSVGKAIVDYGSRLGIGPVRTNLLRMMFSTNFTFHVERMVS